MTIEQLEERQAAMSDERLIELASNQVSELARTGGKSHTMHVPPMVEDTDLLLTELIRRFKALTEQEKPAKETIDLMGQIPIISLANSMFGKPTKEEREWKVGDMVRITKKLINQEDLEIGCEVEVVEYDANDNTWWVEDVFCRYYGWITTEEAILISNPR